MNCVSNLLGKLTISIGVILKALTVAARAFKVLQTSNLTLMNLKSDTAIYTAFKCTRSIQIILGINTNNPPSIYLVKHRLRFQNLSVAT